MKRTLCLVVFLMLALAAGSAEAAIRVDVMSGTSAHLSLPSTIGGHFVASPHWETRPFYTSPYYSIRVGRKRIEVEWLHDKLYLANPPAGIGYFNISHGYNIVFVNRVYREEPLELHVGVGPVFAHPEGDVDGYHIGGDAINSYHFAGFGVQVAGTYRKRIDDTFSLVAECKLTAANAHVDYPVGPVSVPSVGADVLVGVGIDL